MLKTTDLFDLSHTVASAYLSGFEYPWEALGGIGALIESLGSNLGGEYAEISPKVWVHSSAKIAPTAFLGAPCIIGPGTATVSLSGAALGLEKAALWAPPWN